MLPRSLVGLDRRVTLWMARWGPWLLRVALGVVFLWFGALKFFEGSSPAEELATRTISTLTGGAIPPKVSLPVLAAWEVLIGLGLLSGLFLRVTILLLLVQMAGTVTPLVLFPRETWTHFPIAPTLVGQYIIKNIVLVAAAFVVGATVRGGGMIASGHVAEEARVADEVRAFSDRRPGSV